MQSNQTGQKKQCVVNAVMEVFVSISACMSCTQGVLSCWKELDTIEEMSLTGLTTVLHMLYHRVIEMDKAVALEGCPCGIGSSYPLDGYPQEIQEEMRCILKGEMPSLIRSADICLGEIHSHMAAVFASSEGVIRLLTMDTIAVPQAIAAQMADGLRIAVARAQTALDTLISVLQTNRQIKQEESQGFGTKQGGSKLGSKRLGGQQPPALSIN